MKYKPEVNSFFVGPGLSVEGTDSSLGHKHNYKTQTLLDTY